MGCRTYKLDLLDDANNVAGSINVDATDDGKNITITISGEE